MGSDLQRAGYPKKAECPASASMSVQGALRASARQDDLSRDDPHVGEGEGRSGFFPGDGQLLAIRRAFRLPVNLDRFLLEIHNPKLANADRGVSGHLLPAIVAQGGVGDFHDEKHLVRARMMSREEHWVLGAPLNHALAVLVTSGRAEGTVVGSIGDARLEVPFVISDVCTFPSDAGADADADAGD